MPKRHDVCLVKRQKVGESSDARPCIVLDVNPTTKTGVVLISASDLYRPGVDFLIPKDHSDFPSTGLSKTSFAIADKVVEVPLSLLSEPIGQLTGDLARAFDKWID